MQTPFLQWKASQLQLAGDLVDDIVGSALFRLDIDLAGLDAHLVGGALVGLGALDDIGDVVLTGAEFNVDLRGERGAAAALCGIGSLALLRLCRRSFGSSGRCGDSRLFLRHSVYLLSCIPLQMENADDFRAGSCSSVCPAIF